MVQVQTFNSGTRTRVRDLMQRRVESCRSASTLAEAGRKMAEARVGFLPVIDDEERVVGVLTDRDLCLALAERDRPPSRIQVRLVTTGDVFTCRAEDEISTAMETMRRHGVRRLPVVRDGNRLDGVLSLDDIVLASRAPDGSGSSGPFHSEVASTLKTIYRTTGL